MLYKTAVNKSDSVLTGLLYIVLISVILFFGRTLFIPLSLAALISFILYPVCSWLEKKKIRRVPSILISSALLFLLATGIVVLLIQQFTTFLKEWPVIQAKFSEALEQLTNYFTDSYALSRDQQKKWLDQLATEASGSVMQIIKQFFVTSGSYMVLLVLVPVFSALILYYRQLLVHGLFKIFPKESKESIRNLLHLTIKAYYNFIRGMLVVYIIVGVLNSVGLLLLGVPHAIFFGFTASILTFIPYIGIIVGSLLPITMAWVTFNSVWYAIGVTLIFMFVQYLEANVIFPLIVGNRLNINALATLVTIIAGGLLWGLAGMILFVPFLAILKLIADRHPKMKVIAHLIGTNT